MLPHPDTGKEQAWTRATTIAGTLADRYGLEKWAQRNTVLGLGLRQDLYALAASCTADDKQQLQKIVDQAQEAAKAQSGANLGTALHRLTERIDTGEQLDVPDTWKPDVDAYCQTLADSHIRIHADWIERIVVNPDYQVAGTLDRMVTLGDNPTFMVADLKTGQDVVKYGMTEIALQLALYANATHVWNGTSYDPMPPVNKERALVIHLPVGKGECTIHEVDIAAGKEAVRLAMSVRDWRKRSDLSTPHRPTGGHLQLVNDDW
jgi:hypothetical protein